jgi:hypothetical protein
MREYPDYMVSVLDLYVLKAQYALGCSVIHFVSQQNPFAYVDDFNHPQ